MAAALGHATVTTPVHNGAPIVPGELWGAWHWDPWVVVPLALTAAFYGLGVLRLWRRAGAGRGVRAWEAAAFLVGIGVLAASLVSPLHALGSALFSAHMTQHVLLMVVASPLLALGRPMVVGLWAFPSSWRFRLGALAAHPAARTTLAIFLHPAAAWIVFAVTVWIWHIPVLYQTTLVSEAAHTAQHVSFIVAALMFWMAAVECGRRRQAGYGIGVLYLFTTAMHGSAFGALITFSEVLWYPAYEGRTEVWGLSPLEDQQLGGLVMWVPTGVVFLLAALIFFTAWLRAPERAYILR